MSVPAGQDVGNLEGLPGPPALELVHRGAWFPAARLHYRLPKAVHLCLQIGFIGGQAQSRNGSQSKGRVGPQACRQGPVVLHRGGPDGKWQQTDGVVSFPSDGVPKAYLQDQVRRLVADPPPQVAGFGGGCVKVIPVLRGVESGAGKVAGRIVNAGDAVGIRFGSGVHRDFDAETVPVLGKETDRFDTQRGITGVAGQPSDKDHLDPSRRNPVGPWFLQDGDTPK